MTNHIHVLPVGFDTWRLTEPVRSIDYDVSRAIIVTPGDDEEQKRRREPGGKAAFVAQNKQNIRQDLEDRVSIEEVDMPPLHQFEQVYAWAHRYLRGLADEAIVHVNISSLPRSAVTAVVQAATTLRVDDPTLDSRLDIFYVPVDRYLGVEAFDTMRRELYHREQLTTDVNEYWEIEPDLFRAVEEPIRDSIDALDQRIEATIEQIDQRPSEHKEARDSLVECRESLQRAHEEFDAALAGEEGFEEDWEPGFFSDGLTDPEPHITHCSELIAELPREAITPEIWETLCSETAELQRWIERFTRIQDVLGKHKAVLEDLLPRSEPEMVNEIARYGLTRGSIKQNGRLETLSIPSPPTQDVRGMEMAILFVLSREGAASSIKDLANMIASRLVGILDQQVDAAEPLDELSEDVINQVWTLIDTKGRESVLTKLRDQIGERLRSRLQYNIEGLAEKGYIQRRQATDDSRRTVVSLSQMGQLWCSTHNYDEEGISAMATLLEKELQKTGMVSDE